RPTINVKRGCLNATASFYLLPFPYVPIIRSNIHDAEGNRYEPVYYVFETTGGQKAAKNSFA
ncbi:MAG: hypothetical protein ACI4N8_02185, partial [Megasphaera sp.]|uniref:hypothetical protein n=1 Tax=Megasphaera sp. TaxID=2023260 RepID=UPI003F00A58B